MASPPTPTSPTTPPSLLTQPPQPPPRHMTKRPCHRQTPPSPPTATTKINGKLIAPDENIAAPDETPPANGNLQTPTNGNKAIPPTTRGNNKGINPVRNLAGELERELTSQTQFRNTPTSRRNPTRSTRSQQPPNPPINTILLPHINTELNAAPEETVHADASEEAS